MKIPNLSYGLSKVPNSYGCISNLSFSTMSWKTMFLFNLWWKPKANDLSLLTFWRRNYFFNFSTPCI